MDMELRFSAIRNVCDHTAKIQICMHEMTQYADYRCIDDVPHEYDDLKVFGIGLVASEYKGEEALSIGRYAYAIEIRLLENESKAVY